MIIPKIKGNPPYSDIKKTLLTSDPAMWDGLEENWKQFLEQQYEEIIDFLKGKNEKNSNN